MNFADIFYITFTIVLIILGVGIIFVIYKIHKLSKALNSVKKIPYLAQVGILKLVLSFLGGGDKNGE